MTNDKTRAARYALRKAYRAYFDASAYDEETEEQREAVTIAESAYDAAILENDSGAVGSQTPLASHQATSVRGAGESACHDRTAPKSGPAHAMRAHTVDTSADGQR